MPTTTIVNPKTGRQNKVTTWDVTAQQVREWKLAGKVRTTRDIGLLILADCKNEKRALRVFENALDWGLGGAVFHYIRECRAMGGVPKPFKVAANSKGDCFIITHSGRVLA